jgi:hypothetical protein
MSPMPKAPINIVKNNVDYFHPMLIKRGERMVITFSNVTAVHVAFEHK